MTTAIGDTHGFAVVIAASEEALRAIVRGAWAADGSPGDPGDPGRIPARMELPPGIVCAGYAIAGGQVQIPREELDVGLWPEGNGIELQLGLRVRLTIGCPPVPSAERFDLRADVRARVRVETGGVERRQVMLCLEDVARSDVRVTLTSGDPLEARLNALLTEFVAQTLAASNQSRPGHTSPGVPHIDHAFEPTELSWSLGPTTITVTAEGAIALRAGADASSDDYDSPRHRITARRIGDHVAISIPITLRISRLRPGLVAQALDLRDPMAVVTQIVIAAPLEASPGRYTARLSAATVSVGALRPALGREGATYARNRLRLPLLGDLIQAQVREYSERVAQGLGDISIPTPTVAEIEALIGDHVHQELVARRQIAVWTADANVAGLSVTTIAVRALPNVLAIGLNAGEGADLGAVANVIPTGRQFGVAISSGCVQQIIAETRAAHGFADTDLPRRLTLGGREVQLTALDVAVMAPAIRMRGSGTVHDPFLGTFIVGAQVRADIGLHWEQQRTGNAQASQTIGLRIRGAPAVALEVSLAYWVIAAALALIAFGALQLLGSLIVVSGVLILRVISWRLGQGLVARTITEVLRDMVVWPSNLTRIGRARAVFVDPVVVEPWGMILAGDVVPGAHDSPDAFGRRDPEMTHAGIRPLGAQALEARHETVAIDEQHGLLVVAGYGVDAMARAVGTAATDSSAPPYQ
ncbi:MAG: hypothetical protein HGA45_17300 [Chloroflexales bacterium]|nr:hypothetical protein [Chloroflexales bacterium]